MTTVTSTSPSGIVLQLEQGPLSEERRRQAEEELRETPERIQESVAKLRELLKVYSKPRRYTHTVDTPQSPTPDSTNQPEPGICIVTAPTKDHSALDAPASSPPNIAPTNAPEDSATPEISLAPKTSHDNLPGDTSMTLHHTASSENPVSQIGASAPNTAENDSAAANLKSSVTPELPAPYSPACSFPTTSPPPPPPPHSKKKFSLRAETTLHYRDDEEFLIRFLRPTKFYPESAFSLMQRVADFKDKNDWLLGGLRPETEKVAINENNVVNVLANRDQKGRRVLLVNVGGSWNTKNVTADQIFRLFYLIHQSALLEPESQVTGVVVVMDFLDLSMKQVTAFTPAFSMRLLTFIQDAMPLRLKEVHIVNQPFLFNMVFAMFKPFIREKLKSRMFFHGKKMDSLHKHLDPAFLPKEYGGTKGCLDYGSKDWYPIIESLDDKIQEWNSMGIVKK